MRLTKGHSGVLIAGALALSSQGAWSDEAQAPRREPVTVGVLLPQPSMAAVDAEIQTAVRAHVEALNRRLAEGLVERLEAIDSSRIELAIAEVPTRG